MFKLNWFIEIFEAKSDQARLVAILISALVAIGVVLLNQRFNDKRARRELLVEKIEELYEVSNLYISACRELLVSSQEHRALGGDYDPPRDLVLQLHGAINKTDMLLGLYFSGHRINPADFHISNMPIIQIVEKNKHVSEDECFRANEVSKEHIGKARGWFNMLCFELMEKYGK